MAEQEKKPLYTKKQLICIAIAVVLGLVVALAVPATEELSRNALIVLGIFVGAVVCWITNCLPMFFTSLVILVLFVTTGAASFESAFSGYINTTWWFMLGAMGLAAALSKSGLMKRFAFGIMKLFPPTFRGQASALQIAGLVITPIVPSVTAKTAMIMPMAKGVADTMGYKPKSKGMHGLWLAAFAGVTLFSYAFVNSNFFCYYALGLLPAETQASMGWLNWLLAALPWLVIVFVAMWFLIGRLYAPSKEEAAEMDKAYISDQLKALGPMSTTEKKCLVILIVCVVLWVTENYHGISGAIVAIGAVAALLLSGAMTTKDFTGGVVWDMLLMIGALMGLGTVFSEVGINAFIANHVTGIVSSVSSNPYLLVIFIAVLMYVIRYVYTSQMAILPVFMPILTPICVAAGISPWVPAFTILAASATWNVLYQNTFAMQGFAAFDGDHNVEFSKLSKMSYIFMAVNLAALLISVPIWQMMGLIG